MAESNPNPDKITDEMWRLWTDRPNPAWKLGGFYAFKPHYHSTVEQNLKNWPDSYSIKLPLDLVHYNRDKARAMDTTMSDSEMRLWTRRMRDSALDPDDDRLAAVKEFYGTLDSKTVYGLSKNDEDGPWRLSSADSTHLWHGHKSLFTAFVANRLMLAPILSVESGETLEEWRRNSMLRDLPKKGDEGEEVKYWQYIHNAVRNTVTPPSPVLVIDGDYGSATAAAFADFWEKKHSGTTQSDGAKLTGWLATEYQKAFAIVSVPKPVIPTPPPVSEELLEEIVSNWLATRVPNSFTITGTLNGKASF